MSAINEILSHYLPSVLVKEVFKYNCPVSVNEINYIKSKLVSKQNIIHNFNILKKIRGVGYNDYFGYWNSEYIRSQQRILLKSIIYVKKWNEYPSVTGLTYGNIRSFCTDNGLKYLKPQGDKTQLKNLKTILNFYYPNLMKN